MDFAAARAELIRSLSREIKSQRVLAAMARIPREDFVPPEQRRRAYEDRPLPIGLQQTISQPLIIALMTEALDLQGTEKVLEVGTGSGYQTAILAELSRQVVSTERLSDLADGAGKILTRLGYNNVAIHVTGESLGYPEEAPYDAILVTAGAPHVPDELLGQLVMGGRMVIPVGSRYCQELLKITRREPQNITRSYGGCVFVPLVGKDAWNVG